MGLLYNRIQVNPKLLKHKAPYTGVNLDDFNTGQVVGTLPKGKLKGIYFNDYVQNLGAWEKIDYQEPKPDLQNASPRNVSFIAGHNEIIIKDTRGRLITDPVDLRDYKRNNMVDKSAKCISLDLEHNEQLTIEWKTLGHNFPPCGEFIFVIEEIDCKCDLDNA